MSDPPHSTVPFSCLYHITVSFSSTPPPPSRYFSAPSRRVAESSSRQIARRLRFFSLSLPRSSVLRLWHSLFNRPSHLSHSLSLSSLSFFLSIYLSTDAHSIPPFNFSSNSLTPNTHLRIHAILLSYSFAICFALLFPLFSVLLLSASIRVVGIRAICYATSFVHCV